MYKPYSWINKNGAPAGLDIELFQAMAEEAKYNYKIVVLPWHELIESFKNGDVDVIVSSFPLLFQ